MDRWTKQYQEHPIHAVLEEVQGALEKATPVAEEASEEAVFEVSRLRALCELASTRVKNLDPQTTTLGQLANVQSYLGQLNAALTSFTSSENLSELTTANNSPAENLINHLQHFRPPTGADEVSNIQEVTTRLRQSAGQNLRHLNEEVSKAAHELETLKTGLKDFEETSKAEIDAQVSRIDTLTDNLQERFNDQQNQRKDDFDEAQEEREASFKELVANWQNKFEQFLKNAKGKADEIEAELDSQATALLASIEEHKAKTSEILQIIANTGVAGGFQQQANKALTAKRVWLAAASASMLGFIGFAGYVFWLVEKQSTFLLEHADQVQTEAASMLESMAWQQTMVRVFVATALGVFSLFSARQAKRYEAVEHRNRRSQLELSLMDPYFADLDEEERKEVKKELVAKYFGQNHDLHDAHKDGKTDGSAIAILHELKEGLLSKKV